MKTKQKDVQWNKDHISRQYCPRINVPYFRILSEKYTCYTYITYFQYFTEEWHNLNNNLSRRNLINSLLKRIEVPQIYAFFVGLNISFVRNLLMKRIYKYCLSTFLALAKNFPVWEYGVYVCSFRIHLTMQKYYLYPI